MEWTEKELFRLQAMFWAKYEEIGIARRTDRANMSAIWNRYLSMYGASVIRNEGGRNIKDVDQYHKMNQDKAALLAKLINLVNFKNESVANSLIIANPDRAGQYVLIPRDAAERTLVLGMP